MFNMIPQRIRAESFLGFITNAWPYATVTLEDLVVDDYEDKVSITLRCSRARYFEYRNAADDYSKHGNNLCVPGRSMEVKTDVFRYEGRYYEFFKFELPKAAAEQLGYIG